MSDAVVIALIAGLSAVLVALVPVLVASIRAADRANRVVEQVKEIHILVNSQKAEAAAYRDLLIHALRSAGVDVPPDPHD